MNIKKEAAQATLTTTHNTIIVGEWYKCKLLGIMRWKNC